MKKLVISVLFALFLAFFLGLAFFLYISPLLFLSRAGLFDSSLTSTDVTLIAKNIFASSGAVEILPVTAKTAILFLIQLSLYICATVLLILFFKKILKIYLCEDAYFRHFYIAILILAFCSPIFVSILGIFTSISLFLLSVICATLVVFFTILISVMIFKVLPDAKSVRRREIFSKN